MVRVHLAFPIRRMRRHNLLDGASIPAEEDLAHFENQSGNEDETRGAGTMRGLRPVRTALMLAAAFGFAGLAWAKTEQAKVASPPKAPQAQSPAQETAPAPTPCLVKRASVAMAWVAVQNAAAAAPAAEGHEAALGAAAIGNPVTKSGTQTAAQIDAQLVPCSASGAFITNLPILKKLPLVNWYARFLDGPQVKPMTPKEKAWLAVRDVADPFNGVTILGSSAIAVATNSHSAYGPGMTGWGKYVGVSYSQDMTGEFIGTFLIPSIVHQDPHYHRMPQATIKRRIAHCLYQVVWTQGDNGRGMVNYADLVGFAIDDEIGNLYVPGQQTNLPASAERYGIGLATAPIENFVNEFLPDVARKIHVRVVLIQQIINQVAKTDASNGQP
jgi:hypothetical protein